MSVDILVQFARILQNIQIGKVLLSLRSQWNFGCSLTVLITLYYVHFRYHKLFRMSSQTFNLILSVVNDDLQGIGTNYRQSISPQEKLCVTLMYGHILYTEVMFRQ